MSTATDMVYVFNHLPRTAGGALGEVLARTFRIIQDYPGQTEADLRRWLAQPVCLDELRCGDVLMGHYTAPGGRLHERYPEVFGSSRFRLITFLREPIGWVESHLRYFGLETLGVNSVDAALERLAGTLARSYRYPPGQHQAHPLAAYWFVGLYERIESDAAELLQRMGAGIAALPLVNRSPARPSPALCLAQRERYRQLAAADFELFDRAVRR